VKIQLSYFGWRIASVAVSVLLIVMWQIIADSELIPKMFLPNPAATWASLVNGFQSGRLGPMMYATSERMVFGAGLSALAGVALGALIGISTTLRAYLQPLLEAVRPLPASAIIPVAIAIFGLSETTIYVVIAFGAMWPMLLSTIHGFSSVEPTLYEFARGIGMSRGALVFKIVLPSSLPEIIAGLKVSITIALILAVVCEMLTGQRGLGSWILVAGRSYRSADVFAGVLLLGMLGYLSALLVSAAERKLLRR
jgi:sulfonate transport system permease protein